jgi:hypothetical protein
MNLNTVDTVPRRYDPVTATPAVDPVQEEGRTRRRHAAEEDDHQRQRQVSGNERTDREFKQQRHALVAGVVTAFFPQGMGVPGTTDASGASNASGSDGSTQAVSEPHPADQNLEKAIMRFVHAVFDTLRDYEKAKAESGTGGSSAVEGTSRSSGSGSKTPLSDGLSAMARDYAAAGQAGAAAAVTSAGVQASSAAAEGGAGKHSGHGHSSAGTPAAAGHASAEHKASATMPEKPEIPDPRLASTYAEVVQALRSGANTSSDVRVELAALLQRLAQALRGDQGGSRSIPAVGSLVSTRV